MSGYQLICIVGRLGKDPESRTGQNGQTICHFPVAVSEGTRDKDVVEWFNVVAFDKRADVCQQYLRKGVQVLIEGRQRTRSWESDGAKKYRTEIIADEVRFLERVEKAKSDDRGGEYGGHIERYI